MSNISKRLPDDYATLLAEVKERVRSAQYAALKAVNRELVGLYWDIGKMIAERQKVEGWGKSVVLQLASDLQSEFPGVRGFSVQNLWYMRQFYLEYHDDPKLQPLVGEISWSKNVLIHQIENQSYEKSLFCSACEMACFIIPHSEGGGAANEQESISEVQTGRQPEERKNGVFE